MINDAMAYAIEIYNAVLRDVSENIIINTIDAQNSTIDPLNVFSIKLFLTKFHS